MADYEIRPESPSRVREFIDHGPKFMSQLAQNSVRVEAAPAASGWAYPDANFISEFEDLIRMETLWSIRNQCVPTTALPRFAMQADNNTSNCLRFSGRAMRMCSGFYDGHHRVHLPP